MAPRHLPTNLARAWLPAALVVGAFGAGLAPLADGDLYWHLAAGREMVRSHALLAVDPFSVSAAGRPWPDVHWLFQLGVYGLHALGGLSLLVLVKCLLLAAGGAVFYAAAPRSARPVFVPLFLVALFLCRHLLLVRPVIVTLVLLSLFFLQLERFRRERRASLLVPLPLLQVLWANVQGLFALGPAFIGAYAAGSLASAAFGDRPWFPFPREGRTREAALAQARPLLVTVAASFAASFVTPFGASVFMLPARLLGRLVPASSNVFSANVAENVPPFALERLLPSEVWHFKWFLGFLAVSLFLSARKIPLSHLLLLGGFALLALIGNRNMALLYWLAPAVVAGPLGLWFRLVRATARRRAARVFSRAVGPLAVAAALGLVGTAAAREPSLAEPAPFRFPAGSASVLERLPEKGKIFSADHQGGYLIWRLYPRFRPYIDTRLILRTGAEYAEFLGLADDPERFDAFQRRHGFVAVVLPVRYPDRYLGLIGHLYASRDWKLAYTDGAEVLFLRRDASGDAGVDLGSQATTERVLALLDARFAKEPRLAVAARLQLATLDVVVGEPAEAERVLAGMQAPEAAALSARVRLAVGDLAGAERLGTAAFGDDPSDVRALDLLASVSARRGEFRRAVGFLRQALAIDPFDGEASSLLASMEEHQHER